MPSDVRSISIPAILYHRLAIFCEVRGVSVREWSAQSVREDLAANAVPIDDPGMPKLKRIKAGERRGTRRSVCIDGLTYRRARVYAARCRRPLGCYFADLVEAKIAEQTMPPRVASRIDDLVYDPPTLPARSPELEARCAAALELAGLRASGVHML